MSDQRSPVWTRLVLAALAVPQLVTGIWAIVSPEGWFDEFPGFDPRLVSSDPPFNEHLAIDAGAGFFATGVALVLAAAWGYRRPIILALLTYLAFGIPHAVFHTFNESPGLTSSEQVNAYLTLWLGIAVAIAVLVVTLKRKTATALRHDLHVNIDCADPDRMVAFWTQALGYAPKGAGGAYRSIADPAGVGPDVVFQRVPEDKTAKNRVHLDLYVDTIDEMGTERVRLESLGATTPPDALFEEDDERWIVMLDPEGNEFCVCHA